MPDIDLAREVAKRLGLPGLAPEVAKRATNKLERINCFKKNNVPCPNFTTAKTPCEAEEKAEELGFPCVFKPVDRSGARGVIRVNCKSDAKPAFEHALSHTREDTILIEEMLTGHELSTESLVYNGKIYTVAFADRNYDRDRFKPFFIEDGGEMPTKLSPDELENVIETVNKAIRALGIDWGVAKGDVIVKDGKTKIIEMAARTSGGRFCSLKVPLSNGINILRPLILMSVGENPDLEDLKPKFSRGVAERCILPSPGRITRIIGLDKAESMEGVYQVHLNQDIAVGNTLESIKDHTLRKGYVIALGDTREEAIERAEAAVGAIEITTE